MIIECRDTGIGHAGRSGAARVRPLRPGPRAASIDGRADSAWASPWRARWWSCTEARSSAKQRHGAAARSSCACRRRRRRGEPGPAASPAPQKPPRTSAACWSSTTTATPLDMLAPRATAAGHEVSALRPRGRARPRAAAASCRCGARHRAPGHGRLRAGEGASIARPGSAPASHRADRLRPRAGQGGRESRRVRRILRQAGGD